VHARSLTYLFTNNTRVRDCASRWCALQPPPTTHRCHHQPVPWPPTHYARSSSPLSWLPSSRLLPLEVRGSGPRDLEEARLPHRPLAAPSVTGGSILNFLTRTGLAYYVNLSPNGPSSTMEALAYRAGSVGLTALGPLGCGPARTTPAAPPSNSPPCWGPGTGGSSRW
jgi:hypothetical protein